MASLSADRKVEQLAVERSVQREDTAGAGTYYVGSVVMAGGDDGFVKPVSASTVAGTCIVGISKENKTVSSHGGDSLKYEAGIFTFTNSGFTLSPQNKLAWASDDTVSYSTQGTNRHPLGRVMGFISGSSISADIAVEVGFIVSGTTA